MEMVILFFLVLLAGAAKGMADSVLYHYEKSLPFRFKWKETYWRASISWKNKYKKNIVMMGPKFYGSTTFLVFLTDAWHLMQSIMISSLFISMVIYSSITDYIVLDFIILRLVFFIGFKIIYR